jgi:glycosyltransferase involved in cell wall biosynthesis
LNLPVISKLPSFGAFGIAGIQKRLLGCWQIAVLKRSKAIVAMTEESLEELSSIGYSENRILKVPNGISMNTPSRDNQKVEERVVVIFVGRLSPEKGLVHLLQAWANVCSRVIKPVQLRLVGDGPQAEELRDLAKRLGVSKTVEFTGHSCDITPELNAADIFVLPSEAEGNSNSLLEAMRAGLPIVATRVGGAPIQVGPSGRNYLCRPGDHSALAGKLCEMIANKRLRAELGAAMRARVELFFNINRAAAAYERAYRAILSGDADRIGEINADLFDSRADSSATPSIAAAAVR